MNNMNNKKEQQLTHLNKYYGEERDIKFICRNSW